MPLGKAEQIIAQFQVC